MNTKLVAALVIAIMLVSIISGLQATYPKKANLLVELSSDIKTIVSVYKNNKLVVNIEDPINAYWLAQVLMSLASSKPILSCDSLPPYTSDITFVSQIGDKVSISYMPLFTSADINMISNNTLIANTTNGFNLIVAPVAPPLEFLDYLYNYPVMSTQPRFSPTSCMITRPGSPVVPTLSPYPLTRGIGLLDIYLRYAKNDIDYDRISFLAHGPEIVLVGVKRTSLTSIDFNKIPIAYPFLDYYFTYSSGGLYIPPSLGLPVRTTSSISITARNLYQQRTMQVTTSKHVALFDLGTSATVYRDDRLAYIIGSRAYYILSLYSPGGTLYTIPSSYVVLPLNTTYLSVVFDEYKNEYNIVIKGELRYNETYEIDAVYIELLNALEVYDATIEPPIAITNLLNNREILVINPGDHITIVYHIIIKKDWPWTRNFYSYLILYGMGVAAYYDIHGIATPDYLKFIDIDGNIYDRIYTGEDYNNMYESISNIWYPSVIPANLLLIEISDEYLPRGSPIAPTDINQLPGNIIGKIIPARSYPFIYVNNTDVKVYLALQLNNLIKTRTKPSKIGIGLVIYPEYVVYDLNSGKTVIIGTDKAFLMASIPVDISKAISKTSNNYQILLSLNIMVGVRIA